MSYGTRKRRKARRYTERNEVNKFVVVYNDDTVRAVTENIVSKMYDMADCDYMDNVRAVYGIDETGKLVPVTMGEQKRYDNYSSDEGIYYANAPLKAGKRTVGFVHFSDH